MNSMKIKKKKSKRLKKIRRSLVYYIAEGVRFLFSILPLRLAVNIGAFIGVLPYYIIKKEREKLFNNLNIAFGNSKSFEEKKRIAKEVFSNCGRMAAELSHISKYDENLLKENIELIGFENYQQAQNKGNGILGITAHFGDWELMGAYLSKALGLKFSVIVREQSNPRIENMLSGIRKKAGVNTIMRGSSLKEIFRRLKANEMFGILGDVNTKGDGIYVDFFGHPAFTQKGFAELAIKTKAAIVPIFIVRQEDKIKHKIFIEKPIDISLTADKEKDIESTTQAYTKVIEDFVAKYPHQWMWMHKRWEKR